MNNRIKNITSLKNKFGKIAGSNSGSFVYSFLHQLTNLLLGFSGFLVLIRILPKAEFGTWVLFLSITVLFEMGRNGLIQNSFIKFYVNADQETRSKIMSGSVIINVITTLASLLILNIAAPFIAFLWSSPLLIELLRYYSLTALFSIFYSQISFLFQARSEFKGIFIINLIRLSFLFLGILLLGFSNLNLGLFSLVIFQAIGFLAGGAAGYLLFCRTMKFDFIFDKGWITRLFNYGKYVLGTAMSSIFLNNVDNIMLGSLIGPASVALYNIAYRIVNIVEVPIATITAVVFPKSAERIETEGKKSIKYLYERSVGAILALIAPAVLIIYLFAEEIVLLIAGEQYLESVSVLRIILVFTIVKPFLRQFGITLDAIGKPQINFYTILVLMVVNIISNYILIGLAGLTGAAYGTLFTLLVSMVINRIILKRELEIKFRNVFVYWKKFYADTFAVIISQIKPKSVLTEINEVVK